MPLRSQHEPVRRAFGDDRRFTILLRIEANLVVVEEKVLVRHISFNLFRRLAVIPPLTLAELNTQLSGFPGTPVAVDPHLIFFQTVKLLLVAVDLFFGSLIVEWQKIALRRVS